MPEPTTPTAGSAMERGLMLVERTAAVREPTEFDCLDRRWTLLPEVFSPALTPVTAIFTSWLDFPVGGRFLEMGCGAGVTAVAAALAGCESVTAVDVNPAAVANTRLNADRHGVGRVVQAVEGDLFAPLDAAERFDLIFWNSNFIEPPADYPALSPLQQAFFDPGYRAHRRYFADGPGRLTDGGNLLLGFSGLGSRDRIVDLAASVGSELTLVREETRSLEIPVTFQLWRVAATEGGNHAG